MLELSIEALIEAFDLLEVQDDFIEDLQEFIDHYKENQAIPIREAEEKESGESEDCSNDFLYCVFDQRDLVDGRKRKWYLPNTVIGDRRGATRLTKKEGLCFHHTAVPGGFGTRRSARRIYTDNVIDMTRFLKANRELTQEEWVRAMALAHRYRGDPQGKSNYGVPYHLVLGPNSILYLNLPFDFVTWHGNASNNRFLGVGWDAKSTVDEVPAADLIADVTYGVELARSEGHPIKEFTIHAAYTNKKYDPGKLFVEKVMVPAAAELGCVIDYDFKVNKRGARSVREILEAA